MPNDTILRSERPGQTRLGRTKDRHHWNTEKGRKMHRPGVVGEEQPAFPQLFDQLVESRFADEIGAAWAELVGNVTPTSSIFFGAKKNPLTSNRGGHSGKAFCQPSFRRTIFRSGTNPHPRRGVSHSTGGAASAISPTSAIRA